MDKKIIAGILMLSTLAFFVGIFIPSGDVKHDQTLPWQIETTTDGSTRVFGLVLGKSTLQQAEQKLQSTAEITLFETGNKTHTVEAYFDKIMLAGLSAKIVIELDIPLTQLQVMFTRGTRISTLASGTHKVSLHNQDLALARNSAIATIAYLPRTRLQQDLIYKRFGEPAQRIAIAETKTTHWLYPQFGLDIALNETGNAVLQYVAPTQFARLRQPLLNKAKQE
ncbi:hypothetical protein [Kaarinaea lacus]